jgi:hypothetical protein
MPQLCIISIDSMASISLEIFFPVNNLLHSNVKSQQDDVTITRILSYLVPRNWQTEPIDFYILLPGSRVHTIYHYLPLQDHKLKYYKFMKENKCLHYQI